MFGWIFNFGKWLLAIVCFLVVFAAVDFVYCMTAPRLEEDEARTLAVAFVKDLGVHKNPAAVSYEIKEVARGDWRIRAVEGECEVYFALDRCRAPDVMGAGGCLPIGRKEQGD